MSVETGISYILDSERHVIIYHTAMLCSDITAYLYVKP